VLDDRADLPELTTFYIPRASMRTAWGVRKAARPDNSCLAGAGAFFATPSDLVRFGSAMSTPGLLKAETIELLRTPLRLASGDQTDFGLGWRIEHVRLAGDDTRMVAHRATPNGGTVALLTFPDRGVVVALAANISPAEGMGAAGRSIADAFSRLPPID
jgi:serine beta-lactamase-like protein LACTB